MTKVQRLPKDAKFDYTNDLGDDIYHTKTHRYVVRQIGRFGSPLYKKAIWSEPRV